MNHLDDMFKLAMAIDADNIADITSGKASFAEYPDEKPSKVKLIAWLDSWHDDLVGLGYGASLRGEAPYQLAKLRPRPLIDIPADAEASKKLALETENARITHSNDVNKVEYDGKMLDINNVIACKLAKALRPRAPLLLKKLQTAHPALRGDGTTIANTFMGIAMWGDLEVSREVEVSEYDERRYMIAYCSTRRCATRHSTRTALHQSSRSASIHSLPT